MSAPVPDHPELRDFAGTAPIFPLPSAMLYPGVSLPLHIFEERYRTMTADALAGDRLLALAVLRPGWEPRYEQKDVAIYPTVCLGRISLDERLPDGRYILVVRGLARARVVAEEGTGRPYRVGRLELLGDLYPRQPAIDRESRHAELTGLFCRLHPQFTELPGLSGMLEGELSLGELCDLLAYALRLDAASGLDVLQETNVDVRSDLLLDVLRQRLRHGAARESTPPFPPPFSAN